MPNPSTAYDQSQPGLGYARDIERLEVLQANSAHFDGPSLLRACRAAFDVPKTITQRGWRKKPKFQGRMGSCSGFSRATGGEILVNYASGRTDQHFSEMYCYLQNQACDGTLGQGDSGASIQGSVQAAQTTGFADYPTLPYTQAFLDGEYDPTIPAVAVADGSKHLVKRTSVMKSAEDCYHWLATGQGVVLNGTPWPEGYSQAGKGRELITKKDMWGRLLGWHAKVLTGYSVDILDESGNPAFEEENSHGTGWADGGWGYLSWRLVDWFISQGGVFLGISDMAWVAPRKIDSFRGFGG